MFFDKSVYVKPLISIIVPVHRMAGQLMNFTKWIEAACLRAPLIEVLVIEDGNDGPTRAELSKLRNRFGFTLLETCLRSPGLARNLGLRNASGEWIIFWDSDDIGYPNLLEEVLKSVDETVEVVVGQYVVHHSSGEISRISSNDLNLNDVALNPGIWRIAFRSTVLQDLMFREFRMAEDQIFLAMANLPTLQIYFSGAIFYEYFIGHKGQLTTNPEALKDLITAIGVTKNLARSIDTSSNSLFCYIILWNLRISAFKRRLLNLPGFVKTFTFLQSKDFRALIFEIRAGIKVMNHHLKIGLRS